MLNMHIKGACYFLCYIFGKIFYSWQIEEEEGRFKSLKRERLALTLLKSCMITDIHFVFYIANIFIFSDGSSSLALLDSRILDETCTNLDDSKMIVEELKRHIDCGSSSSQPNSLDVSFDLDSSKPKIVKSPREKTPPQRKTSPSLRKFSSKSQNLPSKSFDESTATTTSVASTKFLKKKPTKTNVTGL